MAKKINWFPGHMNQAAGEIQKAIRRADFILELRDARAPIASGNPLLSSWIGQKPHLMLLNKADLADPQQNIAWQRHFARDGVRVICLCAVSGGRQKLLAAMSSCFADRNFGCRKAQWTRAARGLVLGIPNVGKSRLINTLLGRQKLRCENRPGVTRAVGLVPVSPEYSLFDSPGMLWPNLEDQDAAARLVLLGSVKQQIVEAEPLIKYFIRRLEFLYPNNQDGMANMGVLARHYRLPNPVISAVVESLALRLQCRLAKGKTDSQIDFRRLLEHLLRDFQKGRLGRLSLEHPNKEHFTSHEYSRC